MLRKRDVLGGLLTSFILLLLSGCANTGLETRAYFSSDTAMQEQLAGELQGPKTLLIADNQKAFINTEAIFEQSLLAESALNTAHRRAALDEFSLDIVEAIVEQTQPQVILHLGDILNNSCAAEYDEVEAFFNRNHTVPWFVAPGNHDGFYVGISSPLRVESSPWLIDERSGWAGICTDIKDKNGSGFSQAQGLDGHEKNILDKYGYVQRYLRSLGIVKQRLVAAAGGQEPADDYVVCRENRGACVSEALMDRGYQRYYLHCLDTQGLRASSVPEALKVRMPYLKEVCWTEPNDFDSDEPYNDFDPSDETLKEPTAWRNFVVQRLEISRGGLTQPVIMIDTAAYFGTGVKENGDFILSSNGAADAAQIVDPQWRVLQRWGAITERPLILGHHPVVDFDETSLHRLGALIERSGALAYVSGDTHDGYDVYHRIAEGGSTVPWFREINLGSTIDAPLEYALFGALETGVMLPLHRYAITPVGVKGDFDSPFLKTTFYEKTREEEAFGQARYPIKYITKNYAFESPLWEMCQVKAPAPFERVERFDEAGELFSVPVPYQPDAPFTRPGKRVLWDDEDSNLLSVLNRPLQPYQLLGAPYLQSVSHFAYAGWKDLTDIWGYLTGTPSEVEEHNYLAVRDRSLHVYKINRFIDIVKVYDQMLEGEVLPVELGKKRENIAEKLNQVGVFSFAYWDKPDEYREILKQMSLLIQMYRDYEKTLAANEARTWFKRCSAIYEAQRERR